MATDLSALLGRLRANARQPSLSGALAIGGEVVWADAVGDADPLGPGRPPGPRTRYRVASITKTMTAVAVLALAEAGSLDLGRPVATWLPDAPGGAATVRQFLSHTSGLPAEPAGPWWERAGGHSWDALVAMRLPILSAPGTRFHYSNVGFAVLGRLVERLHGRPWDAVLADVLWRPLGMADTGATAGADHAVGVAVHPDADLLHAEPVADYRALAPAGAAWSTPTDLARLGSFLAGVGDGLGILRPDTLAAARTPIAVADVAGEPWTDGYGLGIAATNLDGRRLPGHSGSVPGFTADLRFDPATGAAAALVGNSTARFGSARPLLDAAPVEAPEPAEPDAALAAALAGRWFWGPNRYDLAVGPGRALTLASACERHAFAPDADGWVGVGGGYFHGERLRAVTGGDGVRQLDVGTFCFTRTPYDPDADLPGGRGRWLPWRG